MTSEITYAMNAISFDGLSRAIVLGAKIDTPTIFLGTFGIGKSAGVAQAADELGYVMVDFRAGEILPEDVGGIGVPVRGEDLMQRVIRAVPDLVQRCFDEAARTGKKVMLFLDEITSAPPAVQAALFQVLLDRKAGGYALPEGTYVVCAGNLATDRSIVEELARPLLNRAMVYNYTGPTFDEFDTYMADRDFHPVMRTFLKYNPAYVCDKIDPDNEQSPTPRSIEVASDLLHELGIGDRFRLPALAATLGDEASQKLEAYLSMESKLIPFQTIVDNPEGAPLPDSNDFAACYMQTVAAVSAVNRTFRNLEDGHEDVLDKVWVYCQRLPVEIGGTFMMSLIAPAMTHMLRDIDNIMRMKDGAYASVVSDLMG